jgi:multicomponent Na+:H+ antiporter subunit C
VIDAIGARAPFLLCLVLWMAAAYLMVAHRNLLKALIGLSLFQSGIILFYVMLGVRDGGSIPIVAEDGATPVHNPLPHALMLTAIVVGVATLGVAMSILMRLQREEGSIDDPPSPKVEA